MSTTERNQVQEMIYQNEDKQVATNFCRVKGRINTDLKYDHSIYGEKFFSTMVTVKRLSGTEDNIPVIISEFLLRKYQHIAGVPVKIEGEVRSYNKTDLLGKGHLCVILFARSEISRTSDDENDENVVQLIGKICKPPVFRKTPFGREICELMLAVNRNFGKSAYIPCIAWGRVARYAASLTVGTQAKIMGRFQSRQYENGKGERRIAYEISVTRFET